MNVLDAVGIRLPCRSCGNNYQVPLRDVLLSHTMLHEGCPVSQETECPPVFQSRLFQRTDIEELECVWKHLEQRAQADGGELVLMAAGASFESQASVRKQASTSTAGGTKPSTPVTLPSQKTRGDAAERSPKTKKARIQRQAHSKTTKQKKRKIA